MAFDGKKKRTFFLTIGRVKKSGPRRGIKSKPGIIAYEKRAMRLNGTLPLKTKIIISPKPPQARLPSNLLTREPVDKSFSR